MQGIGHGCDEEAMRIIKKATYEVPVNPKKMRVIFHKNVRIQFKKPPVVKEAPKEVLQEGKKLNSMNLEYQLTQKKKKTTKATSSVPKTSYNYTINFDS